MNTWCPKCQQHATFTVHSYYDHKGNLIRQEEVCDKCHLTVNVRHYAHKPKFGAYTE